MSLSFQVYDVSSYLDDHPGGCESILINAGVDATDEFNSVHSKVWVLAGVISRAWQARCMKQRGVCLHDHLGLEMVSKGGNYSIWKKGVVTMDACSYA